jgi:hypothetical protein
MFASDRVRPMLPMCRELPAPFGRPTREVNDHSQEVKKAVKIYMKGVKK